jgi:hypothetical protein
MSIMFHGSSLGGRPVGKPSGGRMSSRDPITVAKAAKQLIWSGDWQRQIANDTKTKVMMSLKARMPWAVGLVHPDALVAITKEVSPGTCHWCALLLVRGPGEPELERSEANRVILGEGCQRCRTRWAAAAVAAREGEDLEMLTAGGAPVSSATRALEKARRTVGQAAAHRAPVPSYYRPGRPR